jgi:tetratricopeptide (TPR) repeat protein
MMNKTKTYCVHIFVSYAHEDKRWFDEKYKYNLIPFLINSLKKQSVMFWYDKDLQTGDRFENRINEEIDKCHIAILMLSQPFLNSDFIEDKELPRIESRENRDELRVFPVLLEPCTWEENDFLSKHNMLPGEPTPLINYTESESRWVAVRHEILVKLKKNIDIIRSKPLVTKEPGVPHELSEERGASRVQEGAGESPESAPSGPSSKKGGFLTKLRGVLGGGGRDAAFYNRQGVEHSNRGLHENAIADYSRAIELDPKMAVAFYNRGDTGVGSRNGKNSTLRIVGVVWGFPR